MEYDVTLFVGRRKLVQKIIKAETPEEAVLRLDRYQEGARARVIRKGSIRPHVYLMTQGRIQGIFR